MPEGPRRFGVEAGMHEQIPPVDVGLELEVACRVGWSGGILGGVS